MPITLVVAAVITQPAIAEASPLEVEAQLLANSPQEVQFEFIKKVIPDFGMSGRTYGRLPFERREQIVRRAYYLQSLSMAQLLIRGNVKLAAIFNRLADPAADVRAIAVEFEAVYKTAFGRWPPMVPVDTNDLTERMLSERVIR